ncbi:phospho-N-acetylmuramoyl-pentapeptide-transferase [Deferribacterales bacterium RsTz2092]|nr:phospho-N-acetylmuramoyl-pentapeptide-transferase [Deferribacterales bacterium]
MLYNLLYPLTEYMSAFNVFRYITFRTAYAMVTAMLLVLMSGSYFTVKLKKWRFSQLTKGFEPARHKNKEGTPTMGGLIIMFATTASTLLWADLSNRYVWIALFVFASFAIIGFADDYKKTVKHYPKGIHSRTKFFWQSLVAVVAIGLLMLTNKSPDKMLLMLPFVKGLALNLGYMYPLFAWFIVVGTSNAVNLTDGLDGLAIMPAVIAFGAYAIFAYIASNTIWTSYLSVFYVREASELPVFCASMVGAGLGFLWFNSYPASIFMGDVGSLSIGGALGAVAVMVKQEFLLLIVGGLFVAETVSVILQVGYFKLTHGKRIFLMSPLHHHFELKGWSEPKIIVRFWIISLILTIVAVSTLKLR